MGMKSDSTGFYGIVDTPPLFRPLRSLFVTGSVMCLLSMLGCAAGSSLSDSSDSISGSFESSSKSSRSSSEERKEAYQGDIRQYTEVYVRSNGDLAGFARGVASIGEKYGTSNWEADNATYVGIGEGLAKASIPRQQIDVYLTYLAQGDPVKIAAIQKGFGQER